MVSLGTLRALKRPIGRVAPLSLLALGGCGMQVLDPAGDVAVQEANLLIVSTILMLFVAIPVMGLIIFFAWRYRASSPTAKHRPDWDHSTALELIIWSAPLLIIIMLGAITWTSTHMLDPYRRLGRISANQAVAKGSKPLEIQVVALDWKWLFIYPDQGIATVNQLVLPIDREVRFRLTASSVMNSFYVPTLAGQIYAMPGMETKLHAVLNRTGKFEGFSANYSGAGFSGMHFAVGGVDQAGFDRWVKQIRANAGLLDRRAYLALARPSENVPAKRWSAIDPALFDRVVNACVGADETCMVGTMKKDMMDHMDMDGAPMAGTAHPKGAATRPAAPAPNTPASDR